MSYITCTLGIFAVALTGWAFSSAECWFIRVYTSSASILWSRRDEHAPMAPKGIIDVRIAKQMVSTNLANAFVSKNLPLVKDPLHMGTLGSTRVHDPKPTAPSTRIE
jgi:hypothetical protein